MKFVQIGTVLNFFLDVNGNTNTDTTPGSDLGHLVSTNTRSDRRKLDLSGKIFVAFQRFCTKYIRLFCCCIKS